VAAAEALRDLANQYLIDDDAAMAQYARQEAIYRRRAAEAQAQSGA